MQFSLAKIQTENLRWSRRNFGEHPSWHPLLGLSEEVGELSHAYLKRLQGIYPDQKHDSAIRDAVADIVIFLCDFCNCEGIDLETEIQKAWSEVRCRNFIPAGDSPEQNSQTRLASEDPMSGSAEQCRGRECCNKNCTEFVT